MKSKKYWLLIILFVCAFIASDIIFYSYQKVMSAFTDFFAQYNYQKNLSESDIASYIQKEVQKQNIPGLAVAYIDGEKEENICYGYADLKNKVVVDQNTRFEIGSNSKSFTAYAIYLLANDNKLALDDKIGKYLSDFHIYYSGIYQGKKYSRCEVDITIQQLLNHTSGIPEDAIALLPEGNSEGSLKEVAYLMNDRTLKSYPGEKFEYSTINYDILGYIIEKVSGMSYESFMKQNVFEVNNLENTSAELDVEKAAGYKYDFWGCTEYHSPAFKGNVPAGYIASSIVDMNAWLKLQMGLSPAYGGNAIYQTQVPNYRNVTGEAGAYYAAGWIYYSANGEELLYHSGLNPNFSSYIIMNPQKQIGVCVLANVGSSAISQIGFNIYRQLCADDNNITCQNTQKKYNSVARILIVFLLVFSCCLIYLIVKKILLSKRKFEIALTGNGALVGLLVLLIFVFLKYLPKIFYIYADWKFIEIWMPQTLTDAYHFIRISGILFFINYLITDKEEKRSVIIFNLFVISVLSGIGNSIVILSINNALYSDLDTKRILLFLLICALALYIVGQRIVRYDLIHVTNEIVYKKRVELVRTILNSDYEKFSQVNDGNVENCLVNDTATVCNFTNILVGVLTNLTTVLFCFFYIGTANRYALVFLFIAVFAAGGIYAYASKKANICWENARTIQNTFYQRIHDLIMGFPELYINRRKRKGYLEDLEGTCRQYRNEINSGSIKFANVYIIGELVFTIVIIGIAFILPILLLGYEYDAANTIIVLLYISGPISGIVNTLPNLIQVKISWERIANFQNTLNSCRKAAREEKTRDDLVNRFEKLDVNNVTFEYSGDSNFKVGPLSVSFQKQEISFIIGGNGSGKSTFMKILTGLYEYKQGTILVNHTEVPSVELGELYSTVFNEEHLFETLYGVDVEEKTEKINTLLKKLDLESVVEVQENRFSTVQLSSGQRKRLALLMAFLDDKPIFLFDEWAANQDPKFKKVFYHEILPELKRQGKCIIAVTHDDAYFDVADKLYKMEDGNIQVIENWR